LPFPVPVVDRFVKTDVTTGVSLETEIRYHDGYFDAERRKFIGFSVVETIERSGEDRDVRLTRRTYLRGLREDAPELPVDYVSALAGKPRRTEIFGRDGSPVQDRPFRRELLEWTVVAPETAEDGSPILVPELRYRRTEQLERAEAGRVREWEFAYDEFGNVTREIQRGSGGSHEAGARSRRIELTYALNPEKWLVNLVAQRRVSDGEGKIVELERFHYDGPDSNGLPLGAAEAGLLRRHARAAFTDAFRQALYPAQDDARLAELGYRREEDNGGASYWIDQRRVDYDERGSMVSTLGPLGQSIDFEYDSTGLFPERATNALGQTRSAAYDPWLGTIRTLTHWDGNQDRYFYTPLGRVAREVRMGDTEELPTVRFEYRFSELPISTVMERRRRSGETGVSRSVTYYDGLGEELQRRAQAENGQVAVDGFQVRDLRGDVIRKEAPFFSPTEAFDIAETSPEEPAHAVAYDALSRIVRMTRAGGHELRVVYTPEGATFYDPEDSDPASAHFDTPTSESVDAWEQTIGFTETGEGGPIHTRFRRDDLGRVLEVVDAVGSTRVSYTYDLLSRKSRIAHADAGTRTFLFNARSQMAEYVDAENRIVTWTFDPLGRILEVREDGALKERYHYDSGTGDNLVHRLARVEDEAGATQYSYDPRGRVARATRSFAGAAEDYALAMTYDPDGRVLSLTYPDGHEVRYDYNVSGLIERIGGLFNRVEYDARGRRTRVRYNIGVTETFTYHPQLGTPETHEIARIADGVLLYGRRYEYDRTLHVTSSADLRSDSPEYVAANRTYRYDSLYRLRHVGGSLGGTAIDVDYAYDAIDNLTSNGELGPEQLAYDGTQIRGPISGGVTDLRYRHDESGCLIRRPGQQLRFDARQLLRSVERDDGVVVSFAYDHVGRRIRKRVLQGGETRDTLYIGEIFEVRPDGRQRRSIADCKSETRLVTLNGRRATLLLADIQGSIVLGVVDGGSEASRRVYSAYGRTTISTGVTADLGFGGRVRDEETGLYYFRRRYFDPEIGQFVSPDIMAVFRADELVRRPRSLHPYAYGNNSPATFIDPFGLLSMNFWEGLLLVGLVALAVTLTILSAGALAPVLGVAVGTMHLIAAASLAGGVLVGALIGGLQGGWEGALVGALLGLSIVATVFIGAYIYGVAFGLGYVAGFAIAGTLGGIQAAAFIPGVRQSDVYKGILGWSSWLNPWAWPGIVIGAIWFIEDIVATGIDRGEFPDVDFEARYAMVVISNSYLDSKGSRAGHNMGTFSWIGPAGGAGTVDHEAGHALNNALFGIFQASRAASDVPRDALWELLAESNREPSGFGFENLEWWGA
jgi:RHS repeat-associated protein